MAGENESYLTLVPLPSEGEEAVRGNKTPKEQQARWVERRELGDL